MKKHRYFLSEFASLSSCAVIVSSLYEDCLIFRADHSLTSTCVVEYSIWFESTAPAPILRIGVMSQSRITIATCTSSVDRRYCTLHVQPLVRHSVISIATYPLYVDRCYCTL